MTILTDRLKELGFTKRAEDLSINSYNRWEKKIPVSGVAPGACIAIEWQSFGFKSYRMSSMLKIDNSIKMTFATFSYENSVELNDAIDELLEHTQFVIEQLLKPVCEARMCGV